MLADNIETYVKCMAGIKKTGIIAKFNNGQTVGPSPFLSVKNKATTLIIQLMNELGLTPRGRLTKQKAGDESPVARILRGPKG
jgi:phage terminase small subunit